MLLGLPLLLLGIHLLLLLIANDLLVLTNHLLIVFQLPATPPIRLPLLLFLALLTPQWIHCRFHWILHGCEQVL